MVQFNSRYVDRHNVYVLDDVLIWNANALKLFSGFLSLQTLRIRKEFKTPSYLHHSIRRSLVHNFSEKNIKEN